MVALYAGYRESLGKSSPFGPLGSWVMAKLTQAVDIVLASASSVSEPLNGLYA